ncbi:ribosome small subunit-dependent GTPase A [Radiobacillus sp. PE A8.2]|uniref:ribosome small subunit-dependent GTPase A n=1 Tax=Radiobacillus sp. PE A8.2 TaxID=3380349 RepID=UPI0038903990
MKLTQLGYNQTIEQEALPYVQAGFQVARVCKEHKQMYGVLTESGELLAEVSGKFMYDANSRVDYPAVGDWVIIKARQEENKSTIHHILPRVSKFSRKVAGEVTEEQIIATNIDTIFLVNALNKDLNVRRIERYLVMAWESGANPVIVLTKSDLCNDIEDKIAAVDQVAFGVPILAISATKHSGMDQLQPYLQEGKTIALLGSSGAGKSTLTNKLFGNEILQVQAIRTDDDKGKHTTTHRELIVLPQGGIVIDTPGMRELQLWESNHEMDGNFDDIKTLAEACRFRDCLHVNEPGCAVQQAIQDDQLAEDRLKSYQKLQKELEYVARKNDKRAQLEERKKWKKIAGDRTRVHRK